MTAGKMVQRAAVPWEVPETVELDGAVSEAWPGSFLQPPRGSPGGEEDLSHPHTVGHRADSLPSVNHKPAVCVHRSQR